MIIDVFFFHRGERWFGARFRTPKYEIPLQVFGATEIELQANLKRVLDFEFRDETYTINKVEDASKIDA